jgi:hypothetical protein
MDNGRMDIFTGKHVYARDRNGAHCGDDLGKTPPDIRTGRKKRFAAGLILALLATPLQAETVRIATFNVEMARRGPGLLLRDIEKGDDPQITAIGGIIAHNAPDILLLNGFDYDYNNAALNAFANTLAKQGITYLHNFALLPNTGMPTGLDLDGDGKTGTPRDAQGFGRFSGQGGMAILSRYPVDPADVVDFSAMLWAQFPGAAIPLNPDGTRFPSDGVYAFQRLSTTGHWVVPVVIGDPRLD